MQFNSSSTSTSGFRLVAHALLGVVMASIAFAGDFTPARLTEHRTPHHDPEAYATPSLKGSITAKPEVRYQVSLGATAGGGSIHMADITGDGVAEALHLDLGSVRAYDLSGQLLWDTGFLRVDRVVSVSDIDDDGRIEVVIGKAANTGSKLVVLAGPTGEVLWHNEFPVVWRFGDFRVGRFDPERSGQQVLAYYAGHGSNYVVMLSFEKGAEHGQVAWESLVNRGSCANAPNFLIWDYDGDGELESMSLQHHSLAALDMHTGHFDFRVDWQSGRRTRRNYGPVYSGHFNEDDSLDFVVYSQGVEKHITVIQGGGDRHMLWSKWLGYVWQGTEGDEVQLTPLPQPPLDFDGDGKLDLLYTIYSLKGDNKHRLFLTDPMTGTEKLDWEIIKDASIAGAADLDGDEVFEALLREDEELAAYDLRGKTPRELWRVEGLQPILRKGPQFSSQGGGDVEIWGMDINGDGVRELFMQDGDDCVLVTQIDGKLVELWRQSKVTPLKDWSGLAWESDMDGDGLAERLMQVDGQVEAWRWAWAQDSATGRHICTPQRVWPAEGQTVPYNSTYRDINGDGTKEIVSTRGGSFSINTLAGKELYAATLPSSWAPKFKGMYTYNQVGLKQLVVQGRSGLVKIFIQSDQAVAESTELPSLGHPDGIACDVNGDGVSEYVVSSNNWVMVKDSDGTTLWKETLPAKRYGYWVGRFLGRDGDDVVVTYRGEGRAGWMACYNGQTGKKVWSMDRVVGEGGADDWHGLTGSGFVWDADNDGDDDIIVMCNDRFAAISGRDGSLLVPLKNWNIHWGPGIQLIDIDGDDVPEVLDANPIGCCGVAVGKMDSEVIWHHSLSLDESRGVQVVPADTDGDGNKELGLLLNHGRFECWDATTGEVKWTLEIASAAPAKYVDAADIDGDGHDEFVVLGADRVLYCLKQGDQDNGEIVWQISDNGAGWADARLWDFDGDDLLEIVTTSYDGGVSVLE